MSSIPSPNSAFTPWCSHVPSPPNPSSNIEENNYGVIRPKPIRITPRKRKYEDITPNQLGTYPPISVSESDIESSDNESDESSPNIIVG